MAMFRATCGAVSMLENRLQAKEELRDATVKGHMSLATEVVEPILVKYGPTIWGSSEPLMTRIIEHEYPRHLRYSNPDDRKRQAIHHYQCFLTLTPTFKDLDLPILLDRGSRRPKTTIRSLKSIECCRWQAGS